MNWIKSQLGGSGLLMMSGPSGLIPSRLTRSFLPESVQLCHKDGVIDLSEEPLENIGHILNEVVSDAQFDISSIFPELFHQQPDPGFGTILPVDPLMAQPYKEPEPQASGDWRCELLW